MWGQSMEVGREKGQCGLGDVTGDRMSHVPPASQPHTHTHSTPFYAIDVSHQ